VLPTHVQTHVHHLVLSLQHGADPTKKNRDGNTPLDLVKEGDTDIQDLLRGDAALLDAAKKGCLARVQKLCTPENINCRDTQGRNSTPLHLAGKCHCVISLSLQLDNNILCARHLATGRER
jgi:ankyrin repeat protein